MKKLFIVTLVLAMFAGMSMAQISKNVDLSQCKYSYQNSGAIASIATTPISVVGVIIDNNLSLAATSYIVFFDSTSTTGLSTSATTNKMFSVDISSPNVTYLGQVINGGPVKTILFPIPIATSFGLTTVSDVNVGIKYTILYQPRSSTRYYSPY